MGPLLRVMGLPPTGTSVPRSATSPHGPIRMSAAQLQAQMEGMNWHRGLVVLAFGAASVGVTACGGEPRRAVVRELSVPSVSEPADSARVIDPARARYVKQVDTVCARYNPQRAQALANAERAPDASAAAQDYEANISLAEDQLRAVEAVAVPPADRALIEQNVIARLRERLLLRRALRRALLASDTTNAQSERAQLDALTIALQAFARGYGFRVCGAH